jgi:cytochrome c5
MFSARSISLHAVILLAVLVAACDQPVQDSASPTMQAAAGVSAADQLLLASAKVALPPEGTTLADLPEPESPGAVAVQRYCTACHALPHPAMHSATDWPTVARRMWLRMGELGSGFSVPEPEMGQRIVLLDYLTANALRVSEGNLPDGPARQFFIDTCAQCHELPDPRQHSEQDWFVVVRRMNDHMQEILGTSITSEQIEQIVGYLGIMAG